MNKDVSDHLVIAGASGYFYLALIAFSLWLIFSVIVKLIEMRSLKNLGELEKGSNINEFQKVLRETLSDSIDSEIASKKPNSSNHHMELLKVFRRHVQKKFVELDYHKLIIPVAVDQVKKLDLADITEEGAKIEAKRIRTSIDEEFDKLFQ
jgi:hypothetical protein